MKKSLSVLLACVMILALATVAFASGEASGGLAGTYTYNETNVFGLEIAWTLTLNANGTYALSEENVVAGFATYTGTYTANGSTVTCGPMAEDGPGYYDWADPAGFTVTVSGSTFTPGGSTPAAAGGDASGEASGETSAEAGGADAEAAYVEYIHEWLLAELQVNANLTIEQIEDEFMPLVEAKDYTSFPAEMLYNGMLEQGSAMTFEEFAAQYQPASEEPSGETSSSEPSSAEPAAELSKGGWPLSGSGDTSLAAFKVYLKAYMDCVPEMDGHEEELYDLIDAESWAAPVAMAWENWFEENAMTYDEFAAAGGTYSLHRFDLTSPPA